MGSALESRCCLEGGRGDAGIVVVGPWSRRVWVMGSGVTMGVATQEEEDGAEEEEEEKGGYEDHESEGDEADADAEEEEGGAFKEADAMMEGAEGWGEEEDQEVGKEGEKREGEKKEGEKKEEGGKKEGGKKEGEKEKKSMFASLKSKASGPQTPSPCLALRIQLPAAQISERFVPENADVLV
eukprot:2928120-Rhodomonas_salina.2